jgi:hypothetical protein
VIATYVNPEIQDIQAKTPEIFLAFFLWLTHFYKMATVPPTLAHISSKKKCQGQRTKRVLGHI